MKLNIVVVSAVYPPEPQVSARMSYDLATYLADQGYCVKVLCPQPSRPLNADYSKYRSVNNVLATYESNIEVVRLPSIAAPRSKLLKRMWESISFGREVTKYLTIVREHPDVLYVNSWPLFAQAIIANFSKTNGIPMVLQVMDIYPEAFTNKLPGRFRPIFYAPLRQLDMWIARSAAKVVVISGNMRRTYIANRQIHADHVVTIPTWQDELIFENLPSRSDNCVKYGIQDNTFTFLFLGNIGPVAGVEFIINAFYRADVANSQLLIVGDGDSKSDCVKLANSLKLSNVHFISDPVISNVPLLQSMADVCLLPMKTGAGMSSIPSKLQAYLFSAKPVIATVDTDSDTACIVNHAACGWVGQAEDLNWLANKMREVSQISKEQLETIGVRGKQYGLAYFSKSAGLACLADTVIKAAGRQL